MDILNTFGFDLRLFFAQIVNFLVILFVFKKFLYKPILATLDKREKKIAKGLQDAEDAARALAQAEEKQEKILKNAQLEAQKIIQEAKQQATLSREEMLASTKAEIARLMEQTREQIALEKDNFKKESKDVSLEIARTILNNAIQGLFDDKESDMLVRKGIKKLQNAQ